MIHVQTCSVQNSKRIPTTQGIAFELQQVERVVRWLQERQMQDNTLVILAADHGEGLGEHRESEHGILTNSTCFECR